MPKSIMTPWEPPQQTAADAGRDAALAICASARSKADAVFLLDICGLLPQA